MQDSQQRSKQVADVYVSMAYTSPTICTGNAKHLHLPLLAMGMFH